MNQAVHVHLRALLPDRTEPDDPVFSGGGSRPNARFAELCKLAALKPKQDIETGQEKAWGLKDLRKTCATYYDEHMHESSIEILGHSVAGITYRHYAHRAPLAFKAITTLPQPSAFMSLVRGIEGECPCCKRRF
jgi:integrase